MAGPIRISVLANATQANRALQDTSSRAQRMGATFRKAAIPATAALGAIAVAAKQSLAAASDQQEAISKTGVIFGKQAQAIERFADRAATALGQSKTQALEATSTFGQIAQGAGLTGKAAAGFSKRFTVLASDLASFNNSTPQEAIDAIGSAMRGEAEPIRRFGVSLDDATLRAAALKRGLIDNVKQALTPQQKALAASTVILEKTKKAQGDFARTSSGAANSQRIVAAQVENLKAKLGTALLPAFQKILQAVSKVVALFTKHESVAKALVVGLGALAVAVLAVNAAMLLNPAVLIVAGLVALGAALVAAYQRSEGFRRVVDQIASVVRTQVLPALQRFGAYVVDTVIPAVVKVVQAIGARLKPILTQIAATFRTQVQPTIAKVVAKFREMSPTIAKVVSFVAKMYAGYLKFVAAVAGKVIPVIIRFAGFIISTVVPAIAEVIGFLVDVAAKTIDFAKAVVDAGKDAVDFARKVVTKVGEVVRTVAGLPGKAVEALAGIGSTLLQAGRDLIQGLIDGISEMVGKVKDKLGEVTKLLPDWKGPPAKDKRLLTPAGRMIMQGLVDGITGGTPGVERVLGRVTTLIERTLTKRIANDKKARAAIKRTVAGLREEYDALNDNARAQDRIARQLADRRRALADLIKTSRDYATGIRDTVLAYGSVTAAGEGAGFANSTQLLDVMRARLAQAQDFAAKIKALIKAGLNKTTIQQLLDAGIEGGLGTATTLLAGGSAVIGEVNTLTSQLAAAGQGLGNTVADTMYGAGIQAAQGLVRGLEAQAKRLDKIARRLAETLVEAVKKALKIKSPSRVFRDLGRFTARGLTLGLDDVDVRGAGLRMADLLSAGFSAPTLAASVAGSAQQTLAIDLRLSADQVDQLARGRRIQADLDAYRRLGGRSVA